MTLPLGRAEAFRRPVDGLGAAEVVALAQFAAQGVAGLGFVLGVDAVGNQGDADLVGCLDEGLNLLLPLVLRSTPRARTGASLR